VTTWQRLQPASQAAAPASVLLRLKLKDTAGCTVVSKFLVAAMCIAAILIWPHL
jgi:hypothetical protein